ncbi:hypothetical protein FB567DRAFT_586182 [Paraphoma chrysanthemicola]|uniref:Uncharacterized protein n=1 Tax=Paraphoma chrysanthemicola TaxID=798071 RepID=A0A8K0RHB9_9PLEO|nr:hypothetical protein FB567DRAFT_586182 [Paraphoma chrysanthemicola]
MNPTNSTVGWTSEPNGRGTMGLLWSCFATTFLCTWSAIHPNLPGLADSEWRIFWRRAGYFGLCLLAPELVVLCALDEFIDAKEIQSQSPASNRWSMKKCYFLAMGGFVFETNDGVEVARKRLPIKDLYDLLKTGKLSWPEVEECDITDRSKSDWFIKSLALVQILWFTTQIIGRAAQSLAVTTLELFTLGIVFCAVCIYGLWWAKPFDIRQPIIIDDKTRVTALQESCTRIRVNYGDIIHESDRIFQLAAVVIVIIFGGIHVVAWQFHFPTYAEQLTWRICSIASTIIPILLVLYSLFSEEDIVARVFVGLYVVIRLYMFVEMFVSLRSVPASVYKTPEWSNYFPTLG